MTTAQETKVSHSHHNTLTIINNNLYSLRAAIIQLFSLNRHKLPDVRHVYAKRQSACAAAGMSNFAQSARNKRKTSIK